MDRLSGFKLADLSATVIDRRTLLRRTAIGVGGFALFPLLAACGGDDEESTDAEEGDEEDGEDQEVAEEDEEEDDTPVADDDAEEDDEDEEAPEEDDDDEDEEEDDAPSNGEGVVGGRFTVAVDITVTHLDIQTSSDTMTRIIGNHVYETLLAYGEDYAVVPRLAEAWEMSDDGTVCTLNLRDDILYHNGDSLVADDVLATIERYMEYGARGVLPDFVESASDPDEHTVEIQLLQPEFRFIDMLASPSIGMHIQPRAIIEGKAVEELGPDEYIGTGPYKVDEFTASEEVLMSRFDDYYEPEGERDGYGGAKTAYFDEIRWLVVPETGARVSGLQAEEYDYVRSIPSAERSRLEDNPDTTTNLAGAPFWWALGFNAHEDAGISTNHTFRQAVQARADARQIADLITGGDEDLYELQPSIYKTVQESWWTDAGGELFNMNDPELAQELLEESGYDGEEFIIAYNPTLEPHNGIAEGMAAQLREIGITVELLALDAAALDALLEEGEGWHATPDLFSIRFGPLDWLGTFGCATARRFWCNEDFDAAANELRATADEEEQKVLNDEMQRIWHEDANWIKTLDLFDLRGMAANIQGYQPWYLERFWGVWRE
jgi:peptide/nickel transport system substrate-binding protein